jgi:hypothetical protein
MQLQCDDHISQLRPYFKDPNGQKLAIGVANLPTKFGDDPTVNESGIFDLVRLLQEKRE